MTPLAVIMLVGQTLIVIVTLAAWIERRRKWLAWLGAAFTMMLLRRVTAVATIEGLEWQFWDRQFLPCAITVTMLVGVVLLLFER